jgi:uncharacterized membrane protein
MLQSRSPYTSARDIAALLVTSVSLWLALVSYVSAETINLFQADIVVEPEGTLLVTETIEYDFEGAYRHGISRELSERSAQRASSWYKTRCVDYDLILVSMDGADVPHIIEPYQGLKVRIGDPDATLSGKHTYKIVYRVRGALVEYDGVPEIYWNATGDEWDVPMQEVVVRVSGEPPVILGDDIACYQGIKSSDTSCNFTSSTDGVTTFRTSLNAREELTVANSLILQETVEPLERTNGLLLLGIALLVWFVSYGTWLYRWRLKYWTKRSIVAQYEPYEDFKPMFTGVLRDGRLDSRDITAGIIYLAEQGHITIKHYKNKYIFGITANDYEIALTNKLQLRDIDKKILSLLFGEKLKPGEVVQLSEIRRSTTQQAQNSKLLNELRSAIEKELIKEGFIEQRMSRSVRLILFILSGFVGWFVFIFSGIMSSAMPYSTALPALVFASLVSFLLYIALGTERRTRRGYEALWHLKGFQDFLTVTDKERFTFHNAPQKNAKQFLQYLPYAVAFGVEEEWSEVFKDINIQQPDWYSSSSGSQFSASSLATSLSAFSSSLSSSTGSSGSSGGGSSGGGSGGGGGGSW